MMADVIKRDDLEGQLKAREIEGKRLARFLPSRGVVPRAVVTAAEQCKKPVRVHKKFWIRPRQ